jgi:fluoride exporter
VRTTGFWIALGGGLGSLARYGVSGVLIPWSDVGYPWGTFTVNVAGSALLGFLAAALTAPLISPRLRGFLTIGFCGGFTTFSAFDYETLTMLRLGRHGAAALYSAGSVAACLIGVFAGIALARLITSTRSTPPPPAPEQPPPRP